MPKQQIAYVVTDGSYSDYSIYGVFLDKSLAEQFIRIYKPGAEIEEWVIGKARLFTGLQVYNVFFRADGSVSECERQRPHLRAGMPGPILGVHGSGGKCSLVRCQGVDKDDAVRRAIEIRTQYLAEQAGLT